MNKIQLKMSEQVWEEPQSTLLEELHTEFGHIKIVQSLSDKTVTYYQDQCLQSKVSHEGESQFSYIHLMYRLIRKVKARRILMIGCGGGTLATMLQRQGCEVTIVDINPHAFILAKKYFFLPEEVECIEEEGLTYLLNTTERFDAIAIDAFDNHGFVPSHFIQEDFFQIAKEALQSQSSLLVMNVIISSQDLYIAKRIASQMQNTELASLIFHFQNNLNVIIAGGNTEPLRIFSDNEFACIKNKEEIYE